MLVSWRQKCLLFTLLAFIVLSEASRLPKNYWEQMLPKKLPTPSSTPSRRTNSVSTASASKMVKALPSSDGKGDAYVCLREKQTLLVDFFNSVCGHINVQVIEQIFIPDQDDRMDTDIDFM